MCRITMLRNDYSKLLSPLATVIYAREYIDLLEVRFFGDGDVDKVSNVIKTRCQRGEHYLLKSNANIVAAA
jgi:hypothetical protein